VTRIPTRGSVLNLQGLCAIGVAVVAAAPIVRRLLSGTLDIFEPIFWACAMLFALFAVRPLVMLGTQNVTFENLIDVRQGFGRAVLLGFLGTVALVAGYELWPLVRRRAVATFPVIRLDLGRTRTAAGWLVGIGAGLYLTRLAIAGNPLQTLKVLAAGRSLASADTNVSAYLSDGPLLFASAATIITLARRGELTTRDRVTVVILVVAAAGAFALLGNRRLILPSVAVPILVYYMCNNRRPRWRTLAIILPVAFVVLATIPFARSSGVRQQTQGGVAGVFEQSLTQPFKSVGKFFTGPDTAMVPDLALEVQALRSPSDYYFGRATIGDLLLSPIPSALVPGKPKTARNDLLISLFGAPCQARSGSQCPDFSSVGTFYQDFSYFGVVVGMLVLGVFSVALWSRYQEWPGNPTRLMLAASWTLSLLIIVRAGFMPSFAWWLEFILPTWFALRFAQVPERGKAMATSPPMPVRHGGG
jgi:hypothetical protein